ncbi:MAG: hypothetical protein QM681_09755 [Novosphingobium sp.]
MKQVPEMLIATEDDVRQGLEATALYGWPKDEQDLVRLFNAMLSTILSRYPSSSLE